MAADSPPPAPMVVDARGHRCPAPTLRLRRALEAAPVGAELLLLADDPMARIDVPHLVAAQGHTLIGVEDLDGAIHFRVVKRAAESSQAQR